MAFYQNLVSIGTDPNYPTIGNWYTSDKDFYVTEHYGGPEPLANLADFIPRTDDIYIMSFPRSGATLLQEVVFLVNSNLDFEKAKSKHFMVRCPHLESSWNPTNVESVPSPRYMRSHFSYSMIPQSVLSLKCKMLYIMRNPKDTLVSYYNFSKGTQSLKFAGDFQAFFDAFLEDKVVFGPYWKHCQEFWERRNNENIFVTTFEEMKKNLSSVVRKMAKFFGKPLSDAQIDSVVRHCEFEAMKKNPTINPNLDLQFSQFYNEAVSPYLRKGEVGDWKNYFTDDMNKRMDEYVAKYCKGIKFIYQL